jgi:hypothetical protein
MTVAIEERLLDAAETQIVYSQLRDDLIEEELWHEDGLDIIYKLNGKKYRACYDHQTWFMDIIFEGNY